jgi:O-antigen/teichoic acid export membrane protein
LQQKLPVYGAGIACIFLLLLGSFLRFRATRMQANGPVGCGLFVAIIAAVVLLIFAVHDLGATSALVFLLGGLMALALIWYLPTLAAYLSAGKVAKQ